MRNLLSCLNFPVSSGQNRFRKWDRLWDDAFRDFDNWLSKSQSITKQDFDVNIYEKDKNWIVEAALPKVKKEEVQLTLENGILEISIENKEEKNEGGVNYSVQEFSYDGLKRSFKIPKNVDENKVDAKLENGILTMVFNKREPPTSTKIEIK